MIHLDFRRPSRTKKSDSDTDPQCCLESDSTQNSESLRLQLPQPCLHIKIPIRRPFESRVLTIAVALGGPYESRALTHIAVTVVGFFKSRILTDCSGCWGQARNQRGGQSGNCLPRNFWKRMYLLGTPTSHIILPPPENISWLQPWLRPLWKQSTYTLQSLSRTTFNAEYLIMMYFRKCTSGLYAFRHK